MSSWRREAEQLLTEARSLTPTSSPALDRLRADPANLMRTPDPWQARVLRGSSLRTLLLCGRQTGKSTVASALALRAALFEACTLVLLLAPTLRQAQELFRKVVNAYDMLGRPVASARQTQLSLTLANRSRVIALPSDDKNVRGYSGVSLLLIDEASRTRDSLYYSVRPMLATSRGRLVALSTPAGKRGWFYEAWSGAEAWDRVKVTADQCPRIPAEFLAEERRALGERFFRQEYEVSFEENTDAVFSWADIEACGSGDAKPLFAPGT